MSKMTQVPREDFEVLTQYHPGEIRYYVDMTEWKRRSRGTKVTVGRKKVKPVRQARSDKGTQRPRAINGTGRGTNKPVRFTGKSAGYILDSSISKQVETEVVRIFANDPTMIVGRSDLVAMVIRDTKMHVTQVTPAISDLLKRGVLVYKTAVA